MTNEKTVNVLLENWLYYMRQGVEYSPEQLCSACGHPELLEELREEIRHHKNASPPNGAGCCE